MKIYSIVHNPTNKVTTVYCENEKKAEEIWNKEHPTINIDKAIIVEITKYYAESIIKNFFNLEGIVETLRYRDEKGTIKAEFYIRQPNMPKKQDLF